MTLLPHENRDVRGLEGPEFPAYKVGPVCCAPGCSRYADHPHHLWRRSALGGAFSWVELWDHTIVGNVVPLCARCHQDVTEGRVWMRYEEDGKKVVWDDNSVKFPAAIFPQPPRMGATLTPAEKPFLGPASRVMCPGCGRALPHESDEKKPRDMSRRRKTWVVSVPDDAREDGALVLDTLLDECRDLFQHGEDRNVRYFTLVQALALVVQNGHLMLSDEPSPANSGK